MVFVTVRLFDATGSYASQQQQERLHDKGFKTRNFDRKMDEVDYRWESFWDRESSKMCNRSQQDRRPSSVLGVRLKRWTIEISGLDDRFSANFLEKFCPISNSYPKVPMKSPDGLSYYVTIATDRLLARDGDVMPISVAAFYINKLEETGLKCTYTKHISPDIENSSPSMIWTLSEWR